MKSMPQSTLLLTLFLCSSWAQLLPLPPTFGLTPTFQLPPSLIPNPPSLLVPVPQPTFINLPPSFQLAPSPVKVPPTFVAAPTFVLAPSFVSIAPPPPGVSTPPPPPPPPVPPSDICGVHSECTNCNKANQGCTWYGSEVGVANAFFQGCRSTFSLVIEGVTALPCGPTLPNQNRCNAIDDCTQCNLLNCQWYTSSLSRQFGVCAEPAFNVPKNFQASQRCLVQSPTVAPQPTQRTPTTNTSPTPRPSLVDIGPAPSLPPLTSSPTARPPPTAEGAQPTPSPGGDEPTPQVTPAPSPPPTSLLDGTQANQGSEGSATGAPIAADNTMMIIGIVGGVMGYSLLMLGVIFLVLRANRRSNEENDARPMEQLSRRSTSSSVHRNSRSASRRQSGRGMHRRSRRGTGLTDQSAGGLPFHQALTSAPAVPMVTGGIYQNVPDNRLRGSQYAPVQSAAGGSGIYQAVGAGTAPINPMNTYNVNTYQASGNTNQYQAPTQYEFRVSNTAAQWN